MDKKLLSILAISILSGCATGSNEAESYPEPSLSDSAEPASRHTSKKKEAPVRMEPTPEERPQVTTARSDAQILVDAVKSENDESIARAANMVLSKNPYDPKALNALGYYHYKKGHYAAATMLFGKALKSDPNASEVYNNLGLTHLALKQEPEAIRAFRKAIEVNPNDGLAAANLGSIYIQHREFIRALVALEIAYRKNSKDPKILNNYGIALTANRQFDQAREMYKQALSVQSGNKDVMLNYAILLIDYMGKNQEGLDLLSKIRFLGPSPEARNRINFLENKAKAGLK